MKLGAHISTAGGVSAAFARAQEVTAECMQVFTRNQNRWASKPISASEAAEFRRLRRETAIGPNMAHASYLVNLATSDAELERKSVEAMLDEVRRADQLGIEYLVFHPGAHMGAGVETGIRLIAQRLDRIAELADDDSRVTILLENTAGQGTVIGHEFGHLRDILASSRNPARLGVCIDSCHAFAAGYELTTAEGYEAAMQALAETVTLPKVMAFHLNDSLRDCNSRKDRHAGIEQGKMGLAPFGFLVNDPRFADHPATLETPEAEAAYARELAVLRNLRQ